MQHTNQINLTLLATFQKKTRSMKADNTDNAVASAQYKTICTCRSPAQEGGESLQVPVLRHVCVVLPDT